MSKSTRVSASSLRRSVSFALTSAISVAALGVLGAAPANAATIGETIASAARGETGNGPCAHGGYVGGPNQNSSCSNGQRTHAWCADFAGWAWAQAGVAGRGTLTDMANSFLDYGNKYGTRSTTPHVGDAVVYNMNDGTYINDHVAIVTAISGDSVTITGGNESNAVHTNTTTNWRVGQSPFGQVITAYISPLGSGEEGAPQTPAAPAVSPTVHLYGIGSDNRVYGNNANYSAGTWDGYQTVDGTQGFKQTTSIRVGDEIHVYAIGADDRIYEDRGNFKTGTWSGFQLVDNTQGFQQIAVVATGNTVRLFALGSDGRVYSNDGDYGQSDWSGFQLVDGTAGFKKITAVATGNTVRLYAIGSDDRIYNNNGNYSTGAWSGYNLVGSTAGFKQVAATATSEGTVRLYAIGSDDRIYNNNGNYSAGTWSGYSVVSGTAGFKRLAATPAGKTVHLYAIGSDDRVYNANGDYAAGSWSPFNLVGDAAGFKHISATPGA
ncbi:CHAP domain-containing protein [Streptomyces erythrochromogenes]|uniref:CHAP domain-containing protein n=1 Tax=Streptomyces erythrochromogenes TaxID=285574 RepID=UPI00386C2BF9|nr:CHAP domain-containing protein [Streptomyces erythrochromogenes]